MLSPTDQARAESVLDPVAYQNVFLRRTIWEKQCQIVRSVQANSQTAVKGCHASGKTYCASGLPLQWLMANKHGKVFTTGPTLRQVKTFWREIRTAWEGGFARAYLPEPGTTTLEVAADRYAIGASSSAGVNIQGLHGSDVLIIADEAPGIEADIWDAIEGIRAGGRVHVLKMGNPTVPAGEFFDCFHKARKINNCISISAFDTPNLQHEETGLPLTIEDVMTMSEERLDIMPFPSLATRRWVREMYVKWGPNHPSYHSRVLAEFPTQNSNAVFELAWIERAKRDPTDKEMAAARRFPIQVGLDVAGEGSNETVGVARVAGVILDIQAWPESDPRGPVARWLSQFRRHPLYRLGAVVVDTVGIGYNFALHLADLGFPVYGFKAGERPLDHEQYFNAKAEAHFTAREWFKGGLVSGLDDEETQAQLSTVLYREMPRGLIEIIGKDEMMKKHGVPSPDRADAVVMAFTHIVPREQSVSYGESVVISNI